MDLKMEAAHAAFKFVETGMSVGLGDGSTMLRLAGLITEGIKNGVILTLCTSSEKTRQFLTEAGMAVRGINDTDSLDLYFDGCDQIDHELNALKSGAGIHTNEKLVASMAKRFIILADESKFVSTFDTQFPLVLEVLPQADRFVYRELKRLFPEVTLTSRRSEDSGSPVLTVNGNHLIDCHFPEWPALHFVQEHGKQLTGVVDISLFFHLATDAVIAGKEDILHYQKVNGRIHRIT